MAFQTEKEIMTELLTLCQTNGEPAVKAIIIQRTQPARSITRSVRIALVVSSNNETLLNILVKASLDAEFDFVGSDVNLQQDLEVDYLYFEAKVTPKLNGGS